MQPDSNVQTSNGTDYYGIELTRIAHSIKANLKVLCRDSLINYLDAKPLQARIRSLLQELEEEVAPKHGDERAGLVTVLGEKLGLQINELVTHHLSPESNGIYLEDILLDLERLKLLGEPSCILEASQADIPGTISALAVESFVRIPNEEATSSPPQLATHLSPLANYIFRVVTFAADQCRRTLDRKELEIWVRAEYPKTGPTEMYRARSELGELIGWDPRRGGYTLQAAAVEAGRAALEGDPLELLPGHFEAELERRRETFRLLTTANFISNQAAFSKRLLQFLASPHMPSSDWKANAAFLLDSEESTLIEASVILTEKRLIEFPTGIEESPSVTEDGRIVLGFLGPYEQKNISSMSSDCPSHLLSWSSRTRQALLILGRRGGRPCSGIHLLLLMAEEFGSGIDQILLYSELDEAMRSGFVSTEGSPPKNKDDPTTLRAKFVRTSFAACPSLIELFRSEKIYATPPVSGS